VAGSTVIPQTGSVIQLLWTGCGSPVQLSPASRLQPLSRRDELEGCFVFAAGRARFAALTIAALRRARDEFFNHAQIGWRELGNVPDEPHERPRFALAVGRIIAPRRHAGERNALLDRVEQ